MQAKNKRERRESIVDHAGWVTEQTCWVSRVVWFRMVRNVPETGEACSGAIYHDHSIS